MIWTFDRRRYLRVARVVVAVALAVRAASMPPSWVITAPATSRVDPRHRRRVRAVYAMSRTTGALLSAVDAVRGRLRVRSIAAVAVADGLAAKGVEGFAPYTDHLYVFGALLSAEGRRGPESSTTPPAVAYLPAVVYFATGVSKLRHSARSWLITGDVVANAVDLYQWNVLGGNLARCDPAWPARTVLAYEVLALPVSLVGGPRCWRGASIAGLMFHLVNYATLRISFWHLAVLHLPVIAAVHRTHRVPDGTGG